MKREDALKLAENAINELAEALQQGKSERLIKFLEVAAQFPSYSFGNVMMIAAQRPDATRVAGFHAWKKLGRRVLKGEKGIAIIAPMVGRKKEPRATPSNADSDEDTLFGFRIVHVFDISQTEGDELADLAHIQGEPHDRLRWLEVVVRDQGIELEYDTLPGGTLGMSAKGRIVVVRNLSPAETFAVLAHEFAHELLHQRNRDPRPSRTIRETEAEAVAQVVCHAFGIDSTKRSSDYIQLYDGNADTLTASLQSIQATASQIIIDVSRAEAVHDARIAQLAA